MFEYSKEIAQAVTGFLDSDNWAYSPIDENGVIRFALDLETKLKRIDMHILIRADSIVILSWLNVGIDDESRGRVVEYITRVNFGLNHGNFEYDYDSGTLRFKTSLICANMIPSFEQIKRALSVNALLVQKYGDQLLAVNFGLLSPKEALEKAEREE